MKLRLMILIFVLSSILQANECKIDYIGKLDDKDNILSYEVNQKAVIVILERGILFRITGCESTNKVNTLKEAYVTASKICFDSDMKECIEVDSSNIDETISIFLEKLFCKEG